MRWGGLVTVRRPEGGQRRAQHPLCISVAAEKEDEMSRGWHLFCMPADNAKEEAGRPAGSILGSKKPLATCVSNHNVSPVT